MSDSNVIPFKPRRYKFPTPDDPPSHTPEQLNDLVDKHWASLGEVMKNDLLMDAIHTVRGLLLDDELPFFDEIVFRSEYAPVEHRGDAGYWEGNPENPCDYSITLTLRSGHQIEIGFYGANAEIAKNVFSLRMTREQLTGYVEAALSMSAVRKFPNAVVTLVCLLAVHIHRCIPGEWLPGDELVYQFYDSADTKICIRPITEKP